MSSVHFLSLNKFFKKINVILKSPNPAPFFLRWIKKIDYHNSEMAEEYLLLDSSIRDWVVLPVVLILVIVGVGRHYVQELIKSTPRVKAADLDEMR